MPIILLIRHGENDFVKTGRMAGRTPGVHLNERGQQQAQELAEALMKAPIKAIYSSPMERAIETAEPLAAKLGQEIIIRPSLIEGKHWRLDRSGNQGNTQATRVENRPKCAVAFSLPRRRVVY